MSERTELEFWIVASRAEGVGLKTLVRIHSVNQLTGRTMADFFGLNSGKIERDYGLSSRQVDSLRKKASEISTIREELDGLLNRDIAIVTLSSESYPLSIRRTLGENAPPILYALG